MLQAMKSKAASWVAKILAGLLIISFGAWGITDYIRPGGLPTEVADVGDSKITSREFNEQFRQNMNQFRSITGTTLDSVQARQLGLVDAALDTLVTRRLLGLEADRLNLIVGDDLIRQQISQEAAFRNAAGQFDRRIFQQVLDNNGMDEGRYVAALRARIRQTSLTDVITAGSIAPGALGDAIYRYRNEKRIAEVALIERAATGRIAEPGDTALREFHEKNKALFTAPELRDVTALYLDPDRIAATMKPSEQSVRNEYESRLASLSVPERRRIKQMLFQDEATARKASNHLKQGRPFDDVAKSLSGQPPQSLGLVTFRDLPAELASAAFKQTEKAPGAPIKSPLGWHVLLVEKIIPGKTPKFEEVRDKVTKDLARELAVDSLVKMANRIEDALAGGATIEEVAADTGSVLLKLREVDARGRDGAGVAMKNLPRDARFLQTVFETEADRTSDLVETSDGGYFIARVDRVVPPKLRPLASIRAKVAAAWKERQRDEQARKTAKAVLDRVKAGASLASAASERKLKVVTTKEFTRFESAPDSPLPQSLAAQLFKLKRGEADMGPTRSGYAVAVVKEIKAAVPSASAENVKRLNQQLGAEIARDIGAQFSAALRDRFPVEINRDAIDALFNEGPLGRY